MFKQFSGLLACAAAVMTLTHSGGALAASTWNLGTTCDPAAAQGAYTVGGNSVTCTTSSPTETATITAYSNIGAGSTFLRASMGDFGTSGIGVYSGANETSFNSQHAFDNITDGGTAGTNGNCGTTSTGTTNKSTGCGGTQEFALVNFGPYKVNLTALTIGYRDTDADVAILRWDGADKDAAQMAAIIGAKTTGTLADAANGWKLVGTESMDGAIADTSNVNLGSQVSSWWIISTYYGTTATSTLGSLATGNDRFKLSALIGDVCTSGYTGGNQGNGGTCGSTVSEPGSLSLAVMAVLGIGAARRRFFR